MGELNLHVLFSTCFALIQTCVSALSSTALVSCSVLVFVCCGLVLGLNPSLGILSSWFDSGVVLGSGSSLSSFGLVLLCFWFSLSLV